MHFCTVCQNMYYLKVNSTTEDGSGEEHQLYYYCRNCGHEEAHLSPENVCVLNTQITRSEQQFNHLVNQFTKYDPTLPRSHHLKCPNDACITNGSSESLAKNGSSDNVAHGESVAKGGSSDSIAHGGNSDSVAHGGSKATEPDVMSEVVYVRYDEINLKYIYICTRCDSMWKNDLTLPV